MIENVTTIWMGNMSFDSVVDGYPVKFDAEEKYGGTKHGPRPKPMVLSALAACTGMDVVSILMKKKLHFTNFRILVDGDVSEEHPRYYKKIRLVYEFSGPGFRDNPEVLAKVDRAVRLSRDNYCAVSAMLKDSCEITDVIILLDS